MAMLWFYCDESYDSKAKKPNVYIVGGAIAGDKIWDKIERSWDWKNRRVGVPRFHASHLNALDHEFKGWSKQRSKRYVIDLLKILVKPKRNLHIASVGVLTKDYERIINEDGRRRLGNPISSASSSVLR